MGRDFMFLGRALFNRLQETLRCFLPVFYPGRICWRDGLSRTPLVARDRQHNKAAQAKGMNCLVLLGKPLQIASRGLIYDTSPSFSCSLYESD